MVKRVSFDELLDRALAPAVELDVERATKVEKPWERILLPEVTPRMEHAFHRLAKQYDRDNVWNIYWKTPQTRDGENLAKGPGKDNAFLREVKQWKGNDFAFQCMLLGDMINQYIEEGSTNGPGQ